MGHLRCRQLLFLLFPFVLGLEVGSVGSPGGLLISLLVFEDRPYVRATLKNLAHLTRTTTHVVIHVSKSVRWWDEANEEKMLDDMWQPSVDSNKADLGRWDPRRLEIDAVTRSRFHVNPEHGRTRHATGMVLKQHFSNFAYARDVLGLLGKPDSSIRHVMMHASTSRLIFPGLEDYVAHHKFSTLSHQKWLDVSTVGGPEDPTNCTQTGSEKLLRMSPPMITSAAHFFCSARPFFDTQCTGPGPDEGLIESKPCSRMSFSPHEGAFFPASVVVGALNFYSATPLALHFNSESAALPPLTYNESHPLSLLDWLTYSRGLGGSAAEEVGTS